MSDYQRLKKSGAFFGGNAPFVEELYERFAEAPDSVPDSWRRIFAELAPHGDLPHYHDIAAAIAARAHLPPPTNSADTRQISVNRLISQYRFLGARAANINPLHYDHPTLPELQHQAYGLSDADLDDKFETTIFGLGGRATLRDIIASLKKAYCGSMVVELTHISRRNRRAWLRNRIESPRPAFSKERKYRILERLMAAELLEKHLHTRYVGQKRFSLEGGDTLIPMLDALLAAAIAKDTKEVVIGMAHRGRINVLINTLGKKPSELFLEFEGKHKAVSGSGDVKYHMGFSSAYRVNGKEMHLALAFNPSHLEIVNPVVEGSVRARQDRRGDTHRHQVLPVIIHGDAAFAGQGVVMETLNLSQVRGFKTGGTINIVINNQIGFTTSTPDDARSTFFCTDVAKMIESPIFHLHGDDIESAVYAVETALDYRQEFGEDVILDLVCFRRHGHNEQDEPLMTQPFMYQKITKHPGAPALYARQLQEEGTLSEAEIKEITKLCRSRLEAGESTNPDAAPSSVNLFVDWKKFEAPEKNWDWAPPKAIPIKKIKTLAQKLSTLPDNFSPHPQLKKLVAARADMAAGKRPLDWGMAETLGYALLVDAGYGVRLSGQDCGRGTFAHRHAVWHDQKRNKRDGGAFVPLRNLFPEQPDFLVIDSILSEEAVLGFEYGYATTDPNRLVVWEAQFGDFANGAQVVIDQFLSSGEAKWGRYCNLVMLLPHGYEGQGPEHSSARIERYLQLCAEYNMQVCTPTTPAQMCHLLLRQMMRSLRFPLIVITPKSLLRHPLATSSLQDIAAGRFWPVLGEIDDLRPAAVKRLVFCAGKIYYELLAARRERKIKNVALIRLEQLYPFPHKQVAAELAKYKNAKHVVWCQEEPGNQGAWHRIQHYLRRYLRPPQVLTCALRPSAASTAAGYGDLHKKQQQEVIDAALDLESVVDTNL